jgi:hypothetical protein
VRRGPVGSLTAPEGDETEFARFEIEGVTVYVERALIAPLPSEGGEILVSLDAWGKVRIALAPTARPGS